MLLSSSRRRQRNDAPRGETQPVCASAEECALPANQPHLHTCAVNICGCLSLSVYPAPQLRPPVFPTRCARVCASVGERRKRLSHELLAVTEESRLWGACLAVGNTPHHHYTDWQLPTWLECQYLYFPDVSFIFSSLICSVFYTVIHLKLVEISVESG